MVENAIDYEGAIVDWQAMPWNWSRICHASPEVILRVDPILYRQFVVDKKLSL